MVCHFIVTPVTQPGLMWVDGFIHIIIMCNDKFCRG